MGDGDDDDELLLNASPPRKRPIRGKATVSTLLETNFAPNGLPYHPDYPPKQFPSFKKNKKESHQCTTPLSTINPPGKEKPNTARTNDAQLRPFPMDMDLPEIKTKKESQIEVQSRQCTAPFPMRPPEKTNYIPDYNRKQLPSFKKNKEPQGEALSRQVTAPFPMSHPETSNSNSVLRPFPMGSREFKTGLRRSPQSSLGSMSSTLVSNDSDKEQGQKIECYRPKQFPNFKKSKQGSQVEVLSHQHTTPFPMSPPGKSNRTVRTNAALRPFPMDPREIKTGTRRSPQSSSESMSSMRASNDSDGEHERKVKRHKEDSPGNLTSLILGEEDHLEEDSIEIDRTFVDPSTRCPYCDEPLPSNPTPQLKNLLAIAKRKSYADPRPRNPRGLKAPLGVYISACQRHHFEKHTLPEAIHKGWPQSIDFKKVPKRVERMKGALAAIIADTDSCSDDEDATADGAKGPRARSVFWREVKKEIKKQGSRTVTSVKGQFASFEKTQPGYYGELGSLIIHQTLYNLFPFSSFDACSITPFTPAEFIQRVLVPEAAVRLIMQDLDLERDAAVVTLRESSQYGVAMFPDTGTVVKGSAFGADGDEGVADRIVMERAKARRLELAEEEKMEEQMWQEEQAKRRTTARMERKEKARQRAEQIKKSKDLTSCEGSEASESETKPRRFKDNTLRAGSRKATDSETDNMSVDSLTSRSSITRRAAASAKCVSSHMHVSDDSAVEVVEESERVPIRRSSRRAISRGATRADDTGQYSGSDQAPSSSSSSLTKSRTRRSKSLIKYDDDFETDLEALKPVLEADEESTPRALQGARSGDFSWLLSQSSVLSTES